MSGGGRGQGALGGLRGALMPSSALPLECSIQSC